MGDIRPEFIDAARAILAVPQATRAEMGSRLARAKNYLLSGIGRAIQDVAGLGLEGELAVKLLAIELGGVVRRAHVENQIADGLAVLPDDGPLWDALRACCTPEVAEAEVAAIDAVLDAS